MSDGYPIGSVCTALFFEEDIDRNIHIIGQGPVRILSEPSREDCGAVHPDGSIDYKRPAHSIYGQTAELLEGFGRWEKGRIVFARLSDLRPRKET